MVSGTLDRTRTIAFPSADERAADRFGRGSIVSSSWSCGKHNQGSYAADDVVAANVA
jgi:hypothetical protein